MNGTSYTFDKVHEHEKTHPENSELKRSSSKMISNLRRIYNTIKNTNADQINNDGKLKCKTYGNLIDEQGNVITS